MDWLATNGLPLIVVGKDRLRKHLQREGGGYMHFG